MSNPLRNANINYADGWFFVTTQVAHNKTMFGVIAGGKCELNELGRQVEARWRDLPKYRSELQCDAFIVMPNHFHAVLKINPHPDNRIPHLSRAMQIFKSLAAHDYLALRKVGQCPDIGSKLWMRSYYDNLITSHPELDAIRTYIHNNPDRWEGDRFGPVTTYHVGNLELLNQPCVAFVASEGAGGDKAPPFREYRPSGDEAPPLRELSPISVGGDETPPLREHSPISYPQGFAPAATAVISTFISTQERSVLAKCLAAHRPYIHVMPAGIPQPLPAAWAKACADGTDLIVSPFLPGTTLNKQRAIWCNQYVLNQASSIQHGTIRPGGTLEMLLKAHTLTTTAIL